MRDLLTWNLPLGRWAGVQVRLHVLFVLFALFALQFSEQSGAYTATILGVWFCSVLLHELGHGWAAFSVGGRVEQIILWPLGGLAPIHVSHSPRDELVTTIMGPLVNLAVALACAVGLLLNQHEVVSLLHPLRPPGAEGLSLVHLLEWALWINWLLVILNVALPAFPLDGGRLWRAVVWPAAGYKSAVLYVARAAQGTGILLCVAAWVVHDSPETDLKFATVPLTLLGVLIFFSARQETERPPEPEPDDRLVGYDLSQEFVPSADTGGQSHAQASRAGPLRQWLDNRRTARTLRQRQVEEDEERRMDEVLVKLHQGGMESLSVEEKALLARVSARIRNRRKA